MRVIAGTAKRVELRVPSDLVRPTTDKVRSAIFSRLIHVVPQSEVLDLFAGSGSLGIEAMSRGATHATFVEQDKKAIQCLKKNLIQTKLENHSTTINHSVENGIKQLATRRKSYDIIFADPPYYKKASDTNWSHDLLESETLSQIAAANSYFILEEQNNTPQLDKIKYWKLIRTDSYGLSTVHIYQRLKA